MIKIVFQYFLIIQIGVFVSINVQGQYSVISDADSVINIIPNGEFDNYSAPLAGFPEYRKKKLYPGENPATEGGWEGGYYQGNASNAIFDIDSASKLSGKNSAHIIIKEKVGNGFFDGCYTVFFKAEQGANYTLLFDAVAVQPVTMTVAMNRQPFSNLETDAGNVGAPYYAYASDRFSSQVSIGSAKKTFTISTTDATLTQGMYQVFFAGYPSGSSEFWLDNVKLIKTKPVTFYELNDTLTNGYCGNPVIRDMYTADPAALVYKDKFYIYTGHDEAPANGSTFAMKDWHVFSSANLTDWQDHGAVLSIGTFFWAKADAWAGQCIERAGKFYWYVPVAHKTIGWFSIGVAVSDSPTGPFKDAIGTALITDKTPNSVQLNIDPTVFIDDDGQAYLYWGGWGKCRMVKLKSNMIEMDGNVVDVPGLTGYTEAPWVHKRNGIYYLSYAAGFPETIDYATAKSPLGPWTYKGCINDRVFNSPTNHQSIVEFKGKWYFVYHNGLLPGGGEFHRSVCIDTLSYNDNGNINKVRQSRKGIAEVLNTTVVKNKYSTNGTINLYPNPLNGNQLFVDIENGSNENTVIEVYSSIGQKIFQQAYAGPGHVVITNNFKSGIYIVKAHNSKTHFSEKVIII